MTTSKLFTRFSNWVAQVTGRPVTFGICLVVILAWALSGPFFGFSDTWQLIVNTGTTIVTFLMVFLIQNTQNRDTRAMHLKLDELLRAVKGAREDRFVDLEEKDAKLVEELHRRLVEECGVCTSAEEHRRHPERHARQNGVSRERVAQGR